jgi:hypothetical protein
MIVAWFGVTPLVLEPSPCSICLFEAFIQRKQRSVWKAQGSSLQLVPSLIHLYCSTTELCFWPYSYSWKISIIYRIAIWFI